MRTRSPLLADTLETLLPLRDSTYFLQACLSGGARAGDAWQSWTQVYSDIKVGLARGEFTLKRLMPLLHFALMQNHISVDAQTLEILRVASLWEKQRTQAVQEVVLEALHALADVTAAPLIVQGVALAHIAYPKPSLRHCHDVDLLIPASDVSDAKAALERQGFTLATPVPRQQAAITFVHRRGLPIQVHNSLLSPPFSLPQTSMFSRAVEMRVLESKMRTLSPADALLLVCGQFASGTGRDSSWAADSTMLLRRGFSREDWSLILESASQTGLSLALFAMLSYLQNEILIAIPEEVRARVAADAKRTEGQYRDAILAKIRRREGLGAMIDRSGMRSRVEIVRWLVSPTPASMKLWCKEKGLRWWPIWYIARPLRFGAIRLRAVLARNRQQKI